MLKFARNKVVNIVAKGDDRLLVHGVLDDDIYSCEINFEVQRPEMIIKALEGRWHRYTTPDCPRALDTLHPAVGRSGSGVLATIRFEAAGQGSSPVHLADVRLGDDTRPDPVEIPAGTQDGVVTVGAQNRIYLPLTIVA